MVLTSEFGEQSRLFQCSSVPGFFNAAVYQAFSMQQCTSRDNLFAIGSDSRQLTTSLGCHRQMD